MYNLCFIYGENSDGLALKKEQSDYKNSIGKILMDFFDLFKMSFTLIPKAFIDEKDFETY